MFPIGTQNKGEVGNETTASIVKIPQEYLDYQKL